MWLAVECKRAYMVPYYNSSKIRYCHHFQVVVGLLLLLFFGGGGRVQINFNILMLCLLVVDLI